VEDILASQTSSAPVNKKRLIKLPPQQQFPASDIVVNCHVYSVGLHNNVDNAGKPTVYPTGHFSMTQQNPADVVSKMIIKWHTQFAQNRKFTRADIHPSLAHLNITQLHAPTNLEVLRRYDVVPGSIRVHLNRVYIYWNKLEAQIWKERGWSIDDIDHFTDSFYLKRSSETK
jgi:hypothetical protein